MRVYAPFGQLSGEIAPSDIPLSRAVSQSQYEALRQGDDDPLELVVEIAPGFGGRGWHYSEQALQRLVEHVDQHSLNGFLGHQKPDDLGTQFPVPVSHWVGSKWQDGKALFRGVVDKAAPDLKRWIRTGRITQPSIFTEPRLVGNEVVDLKPLSIDWAPLGRAGMDSARVVAIGEMVSDDNDDANDPQGGDPKVPEPLTYSEMLQRLRDLHVKGADLVRDLELQPAETIGVFSADQLTAALQPEIKTALVTASGEMQAARQFLQDVATAARAPAGAEAAAIVQLVKDNAAALDSLTRESLAALIDGGVGEIQVPDAVRPILREKVEARLAGQRGLTRDQVKTTAGELMTSDMAIKALLDGHFSGGAPRPTASGQSGAPKTMHEQLATAGFAFESHRV